MMFLDQSKSRIGLASKTKKNNDYSFIINYSIINYSLLSKICEQTNLKNADGETRTRIA